MPGSKRRAKGEGTLEQLPSGLWRCYRRYKGKKISGKARSTKQDAILSLRESAAARRDESASRSFTSSATTWLDGKEKTLSPTTFRSYKMWIKSMAKDPLGALPIGSITEGQLRQWSGRQTCAGHTLRKRLGFVHQILRTYGNLARYAPPRLQGHNRRPLTPQEAAAMRREAARSSSEVERVGTLLCLECGLRVSEAIALRHEDREGEGIRIRRVVIRTTGALIVKSRAKTAKSAGWIPLPPSLINEIGAESSPTTPGVGGSTRRGMGARISGFVLGDGKRPINPDSLTIAVQRVARRAGVLGVPHMGPHALRRTYGMDLLEAGVDIVTAADLMRHDPRMLLEEYARTRTDLKIAAVAKAFGRPIDTTGKHHENAS